MPRVKICQFCLQLAWFPPFVFRSCLESGNHFSLAKKPRARPSPLSQIPCNFMFPYPAAAEISKEKRSPSFGSWTFPNLAFVSARSEASVARSVKACLNPVLAAQKLKSFRFGLGLSKHHLWPTPGERSRRHATLFKWRTPPTARCRNQTREEPKLETLKGKFL